MRRREADRLAEELDGFERSPIAPRRVFSAASILARRPPNSGMYLGLAHFEMDVLEREHAGKALADAGHLEVPLRLLYHGRRLAVVRSMTSPVLRERGGWIGAEIVMAELALELELELGAVAPARTRDRMDPGAQIRALGASFRLKTAPSRKGKDPFRGA